MLFRSLPQRRARGVSAACFPLASWREAAFISFICTNSLQAAGQTSQPSAAFNTAFLWTARAAALALNIQRSTRLSISGYPDIQPSQSASSSSCPEWHAIPIPNVVRKSRRPDTGGVGKTVTLPACSHSIPICACRIQCAFSFTGRYDKLWYCTRG